MVSFGRNWPLAAQPGRGTARKRFLSTVGCSGLDSQGLATILDPFWTILADLGPDRQMSAVETGQMSSVETGQMSAVETRQMFKSQIRGRAQNHQNGPKWVQNGRQASRIHPNESYGHFRAFGTSPAAKNLSKKGRNARLACSWPRPLSSTPQDLFGVSRWGHTHGGIQKMSCRIGRISYPPREM